MFERNKRTIPVTISDMYFCSKLLVAKAYEIAYIRIMLEKGSMISISEIGLFSVCVSFVDILAIIYTVNRYNVLLIDDWIIRLVELSRQANKSTSNNVEDANITMLSVIAISINRIDVLKIQDLIFVL